MRCTAWTLTALLFAAAGASASDDMTVVSKNTHNGSPAGNSTTWMSSDHSRTQAAEGHDMIMDLKAGTITTIDHKKKTYYTITKDDMKQMNAAMQERMNTPEGKKGMEMMQKMTAGMADSYQVKKTGQTRKVGSYTCEEWTITMGAMSTTKECVTSEVKYPEHAYEAFKAFGESMRSSSPYAKIGEGMVDKMKAIKGFPVATSVTTEVMGNKSTIESEVIDISHAAIPPSTWEVPAGYTKIAPPMMKAMAPHGRPHD